VSFPYGTSKSMPGIHSWAIVVNEHLFEKDKPAIACCCNSSSTLSIIRELLRLEPDVETDLYEKNVGN